MIHLSSVHCINLETRTQRWETVSKDIQPLQELLGFDFVREDAITHSTPFVGLRQTVQSIVRRAKEQSLDYVAIAEDDLFVLDPEKVKTCLENPPDDWDLLSGGVYHYIPKKTGHTPHWKKLDDYCSMHFVIIRHTMYDRILALEERTNIDRKIGKWIKEFGYNVYVMYPMPCKQRMGYSDLRKRTVNYNYMRLPWIQRVYN